MLIPYADMAGTFSERLFAMIESSEFTDEVRAKLLERLTEPKKPKRVRVVRKYTLRDDESEKSFVVVDEGNLGDIYSKLTTRGKQGSFKIDGTKKPGWVFGSRAETYVFDLFEKAGFLVEE